MSFSTKNIVIGVAFALLVLFLFRESLYFPTPTLEGMTAGYSLEPELINTERPSMLLDCDYPLQVKPGVSDLTNQTLWHYRPVLPINAPESNNLRYWKSPNNGSCIPADMCGGIYADKTIKIPPMPNMQGWGKEIRVNYYAADQY